MTIAVCARLAPIGSAHAPPTNVTYTKDISGILERRCLGCHSPGGSRSVPLDTYDRARHWAKAIREEVLERRMPPWPAASGFADYGNDRSLSPIEIELLRAWADGGTPLGSSEPAAHSPERRRDTLSVGVPSGHPGRGSRERLTLKVPGARKRWIAAWEFRPSEPGLIQQAILFVDGRRIGSWVPPEAIIAYPRGVGAPLRANSRIVIELIYRKSDVAEIDGGRLLLYEGRSGVPVGFVEFGCAQTTLARDMSAIAITPYARGAGQSIEVVVFEKDGRVVPLCVVLRYEPAYPASYRFRTPVELHAGDVIDVRSSAAECNAGLLVTAPLPQSAGLH